MKNNLFSFATSELSQDAFICWCLNWFNDDSNPRLREMAIALIKRMAGNIEINSVDVIRQFNSKATMEDGKESAVKIYVIAIINHSIGLIIEDKTFTTVHDNQIYRYTDGIRRIIAKEHGSLKIGENSYELNPDSLKTVFWKTGFHYDYDQVVTADEKLGGEEIKELLSPYRRESDILDDYLDNLKTSLDWSGAHGDYTNPKLLENWQYPQYQLMRTIFPAELWIKVPDRNSELYQVYHGTSFGRPWTEMCILYEKYPKTHDTWELFWRIDSDMNGPYLSLRFYEGGLTKETKARHVQQYYELIEIMKHVLSNSQTPIALAWDDVNPGYRGNYKEASIFHLHLNTYLADWNNTGTAFVSTIRMINDAVLQSLTSGTIG